ncbi:MAG: endolytic transglycosylase MltG [Ruminococcaceae bacterium]|nr:endolytic transglycosylase MltG [Oscillospiraceae bacterium]
MKLRRVLAAFLTVALLFTGVASAQAAYLDTETHEARDAIGEWSRYGIILGYDGYFRPDDSITRGEMALILDRMVHYETAAENTFQDLSDSWYTEAVLKANYAGVILGYEGRVRPLDEISRAEAVVMLCRTFDIEADARGIYAFADADEIPVWAAGEVGALAQRNALPFGREFRQAQAITRAEVIQILDALFEAVYFDAGQYREDIPGNVLVLSEDAVLTDCMIGGNVYVAGNARLTVYDAVILGELCPLTETALIAVTDEALPGEPELDMPDAPLLPAPAGDITAELDLSYGSEETVTVILRAGRSLAQFAELLEEKGVCPASAFLNVCQQVDFSRYYPWLADSYAAENRLFDLEGYFLPGSYALHPGSSPALVAKTLLDETAAVIPGYLAQAQAMGHSLDEVLTIASIIEKEVGNCTAQDRATVASIIYNRLEQGMKLQMNVTENYLENYVLPYTDADQETYEPYYNSYLCRGLPAGPICFPRADCIEAALSPYAMDYLFFRSDRHGNIYYAVTYEEHVENGRRAEQATGYLGYLGSVTVGAEEQQEAFIPTDGRFSGVTVLLDPGHGGTDTGAYVGSASEDEIVLAVALKLRPLLWQEGIQVVMTRDGDYAVSRADRVALANETAPDLLLSLHCNSYEAESDVRGVESRYAAGDTRDRDFAAVLQEALVSATGAVDRGLGENSSTVLTDTACTAAMVRLGFLTNPGEHDLLLTEAYQETLAQALASAIFKQLSL